MISKVKNVALLALSCAAIAGCSKYALTVNDNVVYQPAPLFKDYTLADPQLRGCVAQTLLDQKITAASQLTRLVCTSAGISSLAGLSTFSQLEELNLNSNKLKSLDGIATLSKLHTLDVSDNQLTDGSALLTLLSLKQLQIDNNPDLPCGDLEQLASFSDGELYLPKQCTGKAK